jgi:hypothetical protein
MRTEKQKTASRANGRRTHGPNTPEGKATSALNNLRHGFLAECLVLVGDLEAFDVLVEVGPEDLELPNEPEALELPNEPEAVELPNEPKEAITPAVPAPSGEPDQPPPPSPQPIRALVSPAPTSAASPQRPLCRNTLLSEEI